MAYRIQHLWLVVGLSWITRVSFVFAAEIGTEESDYQIRESAANLELRTPWGKKQISGDFSPSAVGSYRFEIPLSDLKRDEKKADEEKRSIQELRVTNSFDPTGLDKFGKMREPDEEKKEPIATPEPSVTPPARLVIEYDDTDRLVLQANRLFNKGKYFEASLVVDELIRKRPEFVRGWVMKGSLLKVQGYNDLALKAWERALVLEPGNKEIRGLAGKPSK